MFENLPWFSPTAAPRAVAVGVEALGFGFVLVRSGRRD